MIIDDSKPSGYRSTAMTELGLSETNGEAATYTFSMERFIEFFHAPTEKALEYYRQCRALDDLWAPHGNALVEFVSEEGRKYEDDRTVYVNALLDYFLPMFYRTRRPWWKFWAPSNRGLTKNDWTEKTVNLVENLRRRYDGEGISQNHWYWGINAFLRRGDNTLRCFCHPSITYEKEAAWKAIQELVVVCQTESQRSSRTLWREEKPAPSITFHSALVSFVQSKSTTIESLPDDAVIEHLMKRLYDQYREEVDTLFRTMRGQWMPQRIDLGAKDTDAIYTVPEDQLTEALGNIFTLGSPSERFRALLVESSST